MDKEENLEDILKDLFVLIPATQSAAVVSIEGLPIASILPPNEDETKNAAMIATILSLAELATQEFGKGFFEQVFIRGQDGYVFTMAAGQTAVLSFCTTKDIILGIIFEDALPTCEKIAKYLM